MYEVHKIRLRLLSNFVILFLLIAFSWWTVLLFTKNQDAFYAKRDLMRIGMVAEGLIEAGDEQTFLAKPSYLELLKQYKRQEWMIISEAFFFVISLVIGLYLINRGYNREVNAALQSRNFLLSITHELKSPIASIRLVLETFMKRQLEPELVAKLGQNALKETERLNDLVNDLLLSARLDTAYEPHLQQIDLAEFIADCVETMKAKYPKANFLFKKDTDDGILEADEKGLSSVILNLLENGVKYSPMPAQIEVSLKKEGGHLVIIRCGPWQWNCRPGKKEDLYQVLSLGKRGYTQNKGDRIGVVYRKPDRKGAFRLDRSSGQCAEGVCI